AAFPHALAHDPEAVARDWVGLTDQFRRLQALLRPPAEPGLPRLDELTAATQSLGAGLVAALRPVKLPDAPTQRHLEHALGWPRWNEGDRLDILKRLDRADREATGRVLSKWPTEPPGLEIPTPKKMSPEVAGSSGRDLRRLARL